MIKVTQFSHGSVDSAVHLNLNSYIYIVYVLLMLTLCTDFWYERVQSGRGFVCLYLCEKYFEMNSFLFVSLSLFCHFFGLYSFLSLSALHCEARKTYSLYRSSCACASRV